MHILNQKFDQIYLLYINNFEYERAKHKLDNKGIIVNYYHGVNGHTDKQRYEEYLKKYIKNKDKYSLLNEGSFGHTCSFINIIKDAKKNNYKKILILEPDIYFCKNFDVKCRRYLEMDFKLLYFGASQNKFYKESTWEIIDKEYSKYLRSGYYFAHKTLGTFAIGIGSDIYDDLLKIFSLYKAPTDVSLLDIQNRYRDTCIVCYPNIICCDLSKSNTTATKKQIESLRGLRWTLEYEFNDYIRYNTEKDNWYELCFNINSLFNNFKININNDRIINKKNINHFIMKDNSYRVPFFTKRSIIDICIENIFFTDCYVRKINQRIINNKIRKISKKSLEYKYYASNIMK